MGNPSRLSLTPLEKRMLRSKGIALNQIADRTVDELKNALASSKIRAMEIKALAEFQSLPSVGPQFAHDLISLGYYSLKELKSKNPSRLYDQLEKSIGAWIDPCVEDQFRLVVAYAKDPKTARNWWDFTTERKSFREEHGYAHSRPKKAWYELDEYKHRNKIAAKSNTTKDDIAKRLKEAMKFIKKNYSEKMTLSELSKIALLSPYHFQRSFKSMYEVTPLEYTTHLRLKKASKLLKNTKTSIAEITIQCGFESTSSFIRLFKKRFIQTPAEFRMRVFQKGNGSVAAGNAKEVLQYL